MESTTERAAPSVVTEVDGPGRGGGGSWPARGPRSASLSVAGVAVDGDSSRAFQASTPSTPAREMPRGCWRTEAAAPATRPHRAPARPRRGATFGQLHAQAAFSFLEGTRQPETLVAQAARPGM